MWKETVDLNISQYSQELSLKEFNIVTVIVPHHRRFSGIFSQLLRMSVLQCTFLAVSENPQVPWLFMFPLTYQHLNLFSQMFTCVSLISYLPAPESTLGNLQVLGSYSHVVLLAQLLIFYLNKSLGDLAGRMRWVHKPREVPSGTWTALLYSTALLISTPLLIRLFNGPQYIYICIYILQIFCSHFGSFFCASNLAILLSLYFIYISYYIYHICTYYILYELYYYILYYTSI